MMREIKFRAWDKKNKRWAVKDNVSDVLCIGKDNTCVIVQYRPQGGGLYPSNVELLNNKLVDNLEITEFTGLLDKNGKEIYEGDILKINGGAKDAFADVLMDNGCWCINAPWYKKEPVELKYYIDMEFISCEVASNIYENPELLT